jgi:hypothetical protein
MRDADRLTPEQAAAARAIEDGGPALDDILRALAGADLRALADPGAGGAEAIMHAPPSGTGIPLAGLVVAAATRDAAARHLRLRDEGAALARSALAALGITYTGMALNATAYVTPRGTIGLVNPGRGMAVETSAVISAEAAAALARPHRPAGHPSPAPAGWTPLAISLSVPAYGSAPRPLHGMTAQVVAWCLPGSSGRAGQPGWLLLDDRAGSPFPFHVRSATVAPMQDWPAAPGTRAAMHKAGLAALDAIARRLAADAGVTASVAAALDGGGPLRPRLDAARTAARPADPYWTHGPRSAEQAAAEISGGYGTSPGPALAALPGTLHVARCCGDLASGDDISQGRYWDLILALAQRVITTRLAPLVEPLRASIPRAPGTGAPGHDEHVRDALREQATRIAALACGPAEDAARAAYEAMTAIYQAAGPVTVSLRHPVPCHPPWDPGELVGLTEIAARLHVDRRTADTWRQRARDAGPGPAARRGRPLPDPPLTISGTPLWPWSIIEDWAQGTARLDQDGAPAAATA